MSAASGKLKAPVLPPEPPETSVSVVVPALNEERYVGHRLGDIGRQTRRRQEVVVVDASSHDGTVAVTQGFAGVRVLHRARPVARGRNLGGRSASGDVVIFLDADVRLPEAFLERFVEDFLRRGLDVACPMYAPHDSTPAVERFHSVFNLVTRTFQGILPSGAGICLTVRGDLFRQSCGFDPRLKFDDIELIRRLSRGRRFGIVEEKVFVSDATGSTAWRARYFNTRSWRCSLPSAGSRGRIASATSSATTRTEDPTRSGKGAVTIMDIAGRPWRGLRRHQSSQRSGKPTTRRASKVENPGQTGSAGFAPRVG